LRSTKLLRKLDGAVASERVKHFIFDQSMWWFFE